MSVIFLLNNTVLAYIDLDTEGLKKSPGEKSELVKPCTQSIPYRISNIYSEQKKLSLVSLKRNNFLIAVGIKNLAIVENFLSYTGLFFLGVCMILL